MPAEQQTGSEIRLRKGLNKEPVTESGVNTGQLQQALRPKVLSVVVEGASATIDLDVENLPWFDGHFDDEPVLPGIALVLWAKAAFAEHFGLSIYHEIPRVKFRQVVGPGAQLQLRLKVGRRLSFAYYANDDRLICSGDLKAAPATPELPRNGS